MRSRFLRKLLLPSLSLLPLAAAPTGPAGDELVGARPAAHGFRFRDLDGRRHRLGGRLGDRAYALVFLDTECPIANRYLPRLETLAAEAAALSVDFFGVLSDPLLTRRRAVAYALERELAFPVLFDASGSLATAFRPRVVPECFVVDRAGSLVYRGRVDDRWAELGRRREEATSHELRDALAAVATGSRAVPASTEAVGCFFEVPTDGRLPETVSWSRDVAPIVFDNCLECHREGAIGGVVLDGFERVRKRARWIAEVTERRYMPPWKPTPGHGALRDDRSLSERDLALLRAWVEAGAPEGDPRDLPPRPEPASGWTLGEPDLVLEMSEDFLVPADGDDLNHCFVLPSGLAEDRDVVAVEFRAGALGVVHHCGMYMDDRGEARALDDAAEGPGYPGFLPGFEAVGILGGWTPGSVPTFAAEGYGIRMPAGSDVVMQIHYHPNGVETADRSSVGIWFADAPVEHHVDYFLWGTESLSIEPGEADHVERLSFVVPRDMTLLGAYPHMHYLGRTMEVSLRRPGKEREPLIRIDDWDFRWQTLYGFQQPYEIPAGTVLELEARFDNSAANPSNPHSPPRLVQWGESTDDEMCMCILEVVLGEEGDMEAMYAAMSDG